MSKVKGYLNHIMKRVTFDLNQSIENTKKFIKVNGNCVCLSHNFPKNFWVLPEGRGKCGSGESRKSTQCKKFFEGNKGDFHERFEKFIQGN